MFIRHVVDFLYLCPSINCEANWALNSISTFKKLSAQFALHFIEGHRYKKSTACLMSIKQQEDETLKSYIARFNKEALSIEIGRAHV